MKYCITIDTDWCNGNEALYMLNFFVENRVYPTVFATDDNKPIMLYAENYPQNVGLHPNFKSDSTQGFTVIDVFGYLKKIYPKAKCFRSHRFFDKSDMIKLASFLGMEYDSNLCTDMQEGIVPIKLAASKNWRYPVFWEDDVYLAEGPLDFSKVKEKFDTPGLKIINVHPVHFLKTHKFLQDLINHVREKGEKFYTLQEIHDNHTKKASSLKEHYNRVNPVGPQATCRDIYAKELEVEMIKKFYKPDRILDLGCGNGHTLKHLKGRCKLGVDFSENLIAEAKKNDPHSDYSVADVTKVDFLSCVLDTVITERLMINLKPEEQELLVVKIYYWLSYGGFYLMCEGSRKGFDELNRIRKSVGLPEISETADGNTSVKIDDEPFEDMMRQIGFKLVDKIGISDYMLMSRVQYPMTVGPDKVRFDSESNRRAMEIQKNLPFRAGIGSNTLWVWRK